MFANEATKLATILLDQPSADMTPIINVGSSTQVFRTKEQPHIHANLFAPLEAAGYRVVHADLKQAPGVDIAGDFYTDTVFAAIKAEAPKALLCNHMFEHVEDRPKLARRLMDMLPEGGLFCITVPYSYHHHNDPIDTMYRPTPDELAALFDGHDILHREILITGTYWDKIAKKPWVLLRHILRAPFPFIQYSRWKRTIEKCYWLFNSYKVSLVVGRKRTTR